MVDGEMTTTMTTTETLTATNGTSLCTFRRTSGGYRSRKRTVVPVLVCFFSSLILSKLVRERNVVSQTTMTKMMMTTVKSTPRTNINNDTCIPPKPLRWEWNYYSDDLNDDDENNPDDHAVPSDTSLYRSNSNTTTATIQRRRIKHKNTLIALFCGHDKYSEMLEKTAPVTKAYGRLWKQDVVVLQGTAYTLPHVDGNCTPPGRRTTLNKIMLALEAYTMSFRLRDEKRGGAKQQRRRRKYDQILILDTDAMMYNFDVDVSTLIPGDENSNDDQFMLVAHQVHRHHAITDKSDVGRQNVVDDLSTTNKGSTNTTPMDNDGGDISRRGQQQQQAVRHDAVNFNAGVLLWNLHHPETECTIAEWGRNAVKAVQDGTFRGDQKLLHQTLRSRCKSNNNSNDISNSSSKSDRFQFVSSPSEKDAFAYGHGSVVRHFIRRPDHQTWDDPTKQVEARNDKIYKATQHVCEDFLGYTNMVECWTNAFDHVKYSDI